MSGNYWTSTALLAGFVWCHKSLRLLARRSSNTAAAMFLFGNPHIRRNESRKSLQKWGLCQLRHLMLALNFIGFKQINKVAHKMMYQIMSFEWKKKKVNRSWKTKSATTGSDLKSLLELFRCDRNINRIHMSLSIWHGAIHIIGKNNNCGNSLKHHNRVLAPTKNPKTHERKYDRLKVWWYRVFGV